MEKEPTREETQKQEREVALKNLKSSGLMNMAASHLVHESGAYGKAGDSAMHQFKYTPAYSSLNAYNKEGKEYNIIQNLLFESRENGEIYTGNVTEQKIMKSCAAIMQESLNVIKIKDLLELMGAKIKLNHKFKHLYVGDLLPQIPEEELEKLSESEKKGIAEAQNLYQQIVGSYQTYLTSKSVSEALAENAKQIPKSLEKILAA